jgi:hypothetical protein
VISRDAHDDATSKDATPSTLLRLRLAPHRMDNTPEILADCPVDHPFFIKDKGKREKERRIREY